VKTLNINGLKLEKTILFITIFVLVTFLLVGCVNRTEVKLSITGYNEQLSEDGKVYYALTIKNEGESTLKISTLTPIFEDDIPLKLETEENKVGISIKSGKEQLITGEFTINSNGFNHDEMSQFIPFIKRYEVNINNKVYVLNAIN